MAYIESHEELENHPKVIDLEGRMGWSRDETIGKLHRFWWWCLKYAPTGNLTKFNDGQLAGSVALNAADGKRFVEAMVASRWIDRGGDIFRVHDWPRYAGTYLRGSKFKREPARWQETLELYGLPCEFDEAANRPETVAGQSRVTNPAKQANPSNNREVDSKDGKDDDPLSEIGEFLRRHPGIAHERCGPKQKANMLKLVECAGWPEAKRCIEVAVAAHAKYPVEYALKVFADADAEKKLSVPKPRQKVSAKATFLES